MQEALGLLDAIMFDEVDSRALAVDGNGLRQVKIVVDDRAIRKRGDILHVCVLGIDLGRVDCEIAATASRFYALKRDLCAALNGQIAACPQAGIRSRGRLDRAAINR